MGDVDAEAVLQRSDVESTEPILSRTPNGQPLAVEEFTVRRGSKPFLAWTPPEMLFFGEMLDVGREGRDLAAVANQEDGRVMNLVRRDALRDGRQSDALR